MSSHPPETPDPSKSKIRPEHTRLRPDDFLTFDELIEKLPKPIDREAIRKLRRDHGLPVHRIGVHTMFLGAEVIAASARAASTEED